MNEGVEAIGTRVRIAWASILIIGIYAFTMLSLLVLSRFAGRSRAYYRTLWMLEHLTEWFGRTGRHRKAEGETADGKRAEG